MRQYDVTSREEWQAASRAFRAKEKAMTRALDALAAERRRLPWTLVEGDYRFDGPDGSLSLPDLFEGRRQLILYHHMLKPADPDPCSGCGMFTDTVGRTDHIRQRDTVIALVSTAPIDEIVAFKQRMEWTLPWYSGTEAFNRDMDVSGGFGLNVFIRDADRIYRTYFTTGRGVEMLGTTWSFLDLTPFGRQETWEDSPEGTPQTAPYHWWRLHDEYPAG
ncbi:MAG: DUF899 domain-containing protein [Alphaproteobacteria bacterium]|nr:DUF899 domain-containing protein [Alphaproteobacteria bacterium]MBO6861915.1 DUF899 domain-containing protein [Alphaproteobacteria bacterium]